LCYLATKKIELINRLVEWIAPPGRPPPGRPPGRPPPGRPPPGRPPGSPVPKEKA